MFVISQYFASSTFTGVVIGQYYASSVFTGVLGGQSHAIHRYTFTLDPKYPVKKKLAAIMRTESGMRMFATPRTHSL